MIRPVELQGVVQRSQDISTMKQAENARTGVEQANIHMQEKKDAFQKSEQVNKKDETGYNDKKFDAKDKGSNEYQQNSGTKQQNKKKILEDDGIVKVKAKTSIDTYI